MNKLSVITGILSILFVVLTAVSCKNDTKKTDTDGNMHNMEMSNENEEHHHNDGDHDDHHNTSMDHGSMGQDRSLEASTKNNPATTPIIDAYIQIKNALVNDDKEGASKGASVMLMAFSSFDMAQLSEAQNKEYMEILESAKEHAEHIVKSPLDHQREHFETLSVDVNDLIVLLGTEKPLYQDYCPMKKAIWLSETKDIKNPYYGSEMLTCGKVQKEIN